MSSTPLTLAALATSAVPGLQVVGAREHTLDGEGAFSSAVLLTEDAELIVRVPRISSAEVRQSAEMLGQAALADGARSALPFQAPETLGITRAGETRAVVSTFLPGDASSQRISRATPSCCNRSPRRWRRSTGCRSRS
ncbi:hypothetical protein [Leucobacter soli]|uniref:hypothetical protein n=1 Tax=Leucobacter soli TaxID=2812850 RepID=UPI00361A442D